MQILKGLAGSAEGCLPQPALDAAAKVMDPDSNVADEARYVHPSITLLTLLHKGCFHHCLLTIPCFQSAQSCNECWLQSKRSVIAPQVAAGASFEAAGAWEPGQVRVRVPAGTLQADAAAAAISQASDSTPAFTSLQCR